MLSLREINQQKYKDFTRNDNANIMYLRENLKKKISIIFGNIEDHSGECVVNGANEGLLNKLIFYAHTLLF